MIQPKVTTSILSACPACLLNPLVWHFPACGCPLHGKLPCTGTAHPLSRTCQNLCTSQPLLGYQISSFQSQLKPFGLRFVSAGPVRSMSLFWIRRTLPLLIYFVSVCQIAMDINVRRVEYKIMLGSSIVTLWHWRTVWTQLREGWLSESHLCCGQNCDGVLSNQAFSNDGTHSAIKRWTSKHWEACHRCWCWCHTNDGALRYYVAEKVGICHQ